MKNDSAVTTKNLFNKKIRTVRDLQDERDRNHGYLKDHKAGRNVEMFWGWNDVVEADRIFKLRFKGKTGEYEEVWLDADQVQTLLRWV